MPARLIYASTKDSDLLYAIKTEVSDPVLWIGAGDESYVFLDHREIGIFESENKNPDLHAVLLNPLLEEAKDQGVEGRAALIQFLIRSHAPGEKEFEVPASFPLDIADGLRENGFSILVRERFFPERARKTIEEASVMRRTALRTCAAFRRIETILRESEVAGRAVLWHEKELTSEVLKAEAEIALIREGLADVEGMIIACEAHSAIPHHRGAGPILAHEPVVCDIFPRDRATGYYADLTRTYVKGEPSPELQKMYDAVLLAQTRAIEAVRPGVSGKEIDGIVRKTLEGRGYHTKDKGFIHGTGHGVGLDVHEAPRLGQGSKDVLEPGNIVTVEPGLYYPELGGIRIEDMVLVTEKGHENLAEHPKPFRVD